MPRGEEALRPVPSRRDQRRLRLGLLAIAAILCAVLIESFSACGDRSTHAVSSPTADAATRKYVALVHNYWLHYKKAEGDIPSLVQVCGYFSPVSEVRPSACRTRIAAILPTHEKFLSDLDSTPAPGQFVADDQAFRTEIPMAIAHLTATIAAADAGSAPQVSAETEAYVESMIPLFPNLDHVDPSIPHD